MNKKWNVSIVPDLARRLTFLLLLTALSAPPAPAAADRELLLNGSFERGNAQAAGWSVYGQGYSRDADIKHRGAYSLRCLGKEGSVSGAFYTVALNQSVPTPIQITGWSRAQDVDGVADNDYSIYVDLTYQDGSSLWGQTAPFATGTHDWQRQRLMLYPTKPLRSMNVYALFRVHAGTVWFDDFAASEVTSDTFFDGQDLAPPRLPSTAESGWFMHDVAAETPLVPLHAGRDVLGIRWQNSPSERGGSVISGTVRNLTSHTRALTIYYVERVAAKQPTWWNDIRSSVPALPVREYAALTQVNVGAAGQISLYPFGCVTGPNSGQALGVPPTMGPCVARIVFHARTHLLFLAYDIALNARSDGGSKDQAEVAVARFPVDPAWGFRSAAAHFYALYPEAYRRRARAEGIWMPFTDPSKISGLPDFHIAYHEGDNSPVTDRQQGILSFRYVEPMTYWMPMAKGVPRTYAAALAQVQTQAAGSAPAVETARRQSQAVLNSGTLDAQGRFNVAFRDAPWCDGAVWVLNPSPSLPVPPAQWSKARLNALGKPMPGKSNEPDGEYLDSLEAWADILDYRPAGLRATVLTPTFASDTLRPVLPTWFSVYEAAHSLSEDLHRHGHLLMANSVPWRFSAFAPLLDVMGTETNMFTDSGAWQPESDSMMNLRRTASYHKPYLLLLNTDFSKVDAAKIKRYFERCAFYGIYPSMFSANAADHPYWEDPKLYGRDRPLFRQYIPVVQRLSAAGWEPVTWAHSDHRDVWLERFGQSYLTVLNSSEQPVQVILRIDTARFLLGATPRDARKDAQLAVRDVLSGQEILRAPLKTSNWVRLTVGGQETRFLSLRLADSRKTQGMIGKKGTTK